MSVSREQLRRVVPGVFRRVDPATLLLLGVAVLLLLAAVSAAAESAVDVGQGWVPRSGRMSDFGLDGQPRTDEEYDTPPMLRAAAAMGLLLLMLVILVVALFGLLAIVLGIQLSWRRRQKRIGVVPLADADEDGAADRVDVFRKAAGHALDRLAGWAGGDPGDAVVLAWLALEQAAADSGLPRRPHQTPTEFTTAVLAELAVDAAALSRLRDRYQRARFSDHPVTEADVLVAQEALRRIVADLDRQREQRGHAIVGGLG